MRAVLAKLIDDFQERPLPPVVPRSIEVLQLDGRASALLGMRRVGKTWCCFQRIQELLAEGVARERILYVNFEDDRLLPFTAANFEDLLEVFFGKHPGSKDASSFLFLDEVQRIEGWEAFVRRVLDTENVSIWVTGSSSKLLSREIATSLRGRSLTTELFPLSFSEFLRFQGEEVPDGATFGSRTRARLRNQAERFLERGGLPEMQSVDDARIRREVLREYLDVMILRDVIERHGVTNVQALRRLVQHVLHASTERFSVNKFYNGLRSQGIACTKNDLYAFLDHLADAYFVFPIPIHARSEKVRQVNPKKVYVIDTGFLRAVSFDMTEDRGTLLETAVHLHLRRHGRAPEYYSTTSGYEVDFIVRSPGQDELIQVCWDLSDPATRHREMRALREARSELGIDRATVVCMDEEGEEDGIACVPAWKWLLDA